MALSFPLIRFAYVVNVLYSTPMKQDYKSVKVKNETYKKLKQLALDVDMPITRLIDRLYKERKPGKFKPVE